ncbi:hypothetical protein [Psychrobacter immobilis]|uniref:hypothetical protein n=1 Tax=Psychrobacter immobilis TaxID=498 RepID=UPI00191A3C78|nr:hypothetical protein [Psychrobacter immobilis]
MTLHQTQSGVAVLLLALLTGCSSGSNMQEESTSTIQREKSTQTDATVERSTQDAAESERLGTKWGDDVNSEVTTVDLRRTSSEPIEQMQVRYADKAYNGRAVNSMSLLAGKVDFSMETDTGALSLYRDSGNYYVQGQAGQAYRLVYHNNSDNTYEIVASVDGINVLNVLNGSAASRYDSGYVLNPHDNLVIEGFRKSQSSVASFIFSKPESAYAANTSSGSINNTGVIGTAVYGLYDPSKPKLQQPQAYPADNGYAKPPQ